MDVIGITVPRFLFAVQAALRIRINYSKEIEVPMKKFLIVTVMAICALSASVGMTQDSNQAASTKGSALNAGTMQQFIRTVKLDGITLSFVLLNNKTVDFLFSGDSKYSIRAKANIATMFFVQGIAEKDLAFEPQFEVTQDGKTFPGEAVNLKNLLAGPLAKGTRISGLVQLSQKINVTQPFTIRGAKDASAEFRLSKDAIKLLEN